MQDNNTYLPTIAWIAMPAEHCNWQAKLFKGRDGLELLVVRRCLVGKAMDSRCTMSKTTVQIKVSQHKFQAELRFIEILNGPSKAVMLRRLCLANCNRLTHAHEYDSLAYRNISDTQIQLNSGLCLIPYGLMDISSTAD
eukprot:scaffold97497_cov31-Prasinocladus_malaysianus.AAC.1